MKNFIFITWSLIFSLLGCTNNQSDKAEEKKFSLYVSPFKQLLFRDDHVSEGFLAPLNDGKILLVFRLDPGLGGDHVGTDGYIAKIAYDPEQDKWGNVETVYNSHQYDDRNIHGGITREGRIVTFFRRFDGSKTEGRYFIYSDDNGKSWTKPQKSQAWTDPELTNLDGIWSTGQMFYNPDINQYAMLGCRRYITFSQDGTSWENINQITANQDFKLTEIAGAWCGDNRIIALIRDDKREYGHPLVQVESYNGGQTWTDPVPTNIPPNQHWGAAPQMIYDLNRDLLIALNSDRYSRPDEQNSLFIYTASPEDVIGNPEGWTLQHELRRPWAGLDHEVDTVNQNFYGYPTIAPINEQEYLVVFTERSKKNGTEHASLYYFRLIIQ
ncbi:MAG: sialidase family protein [Cyclobacteriaceae bacterium]